MDAEAGAEGVAGVAGRIESGAAGGALHNRELAIMRQSWHKSLATMRKYVRDRNLFRDNRAAKLGL